MSRLQATFGRVDRGRPGIPIPNVREPYTGEGERFASLGRSTFCVTTVRGSQKRQTPCYGGLTRLRGSLTLDLRYKRDGSLMDCSSPVNHPTTPTSGMLVGETTRSRSLNSDRGGGPLNAQREARKREPQRGDP
jgi:hypothetical protein